MVTRVIVPAVVLVGVDGGGVFLFEGGGENDVNHDLNDEVAVVDDDDDDGEEAEEDEEVVEEVDGDDNGDIVWRITIWLPSTGQEQFLRWKREEESTLASAFESVLEGYYCVR